MTDKTILFSGPMIRALLDGRKSQTRRVLKMPSWAQSEGWPEHIMDEQGLDGRLQWFAKDTGCVSDLPIPQPGDRLWVRETWNVPDAYLASERRETALGLMNYAATPWAIPGRWRPSIHMPRWASRLTLIVTDVRVQRLHEISEADAIAEGCRPFFDETDPQIFKGPNGTEHEMMPLKGPVDAFRTLWDSLNADRGFGWDANPWVSATTFTVHKCNIDQIEAA